METLPSINWIRDFFRLSEHPFQTNYDSKYKWQKFEALAPLRPQLAGPHISRRGGQSFDIHPTRNEEKEASLSPWDSWDRLWRQLLSSHAGLVNESEDSLREWLISWDARRLFEEVKHVMRNKLEEAMIPILDTASLWLKDVSKDLENAILGPLELHSKRLEGLNKLLANKTALNILFNPAEDKANAIMVLKMAPRLLLHLSEGLVKDMGNYFVGTELSLQTLKETDKCLAHLARFVASVVADLERFKAPRAVALAKMGHDTVNKLRWIISKLILRLEEQQDTKQATAVKIERNDVDEILSTINRGEEIINVLGV